jgi:D-threo-aldose 1-dehydrogenase
LLDQTGLSLLDICEARGVSVIAASVFQGGILADPERWRPYYDRADIDYALSIEKRCAEYGVSLAAAALQFPFGHPAVRAVLVGVRSVDEIDRNVHLYSQTIPAQLWNELKDDGFITSTAPLPSAETVGK